MNNTVWEGSKKIIESLTAVKPTYLVVNYGIREILYFFWLILTMEIIETKPTSLTFEKYEVRGDNYRVK